MATDDQVARSVDKHLRANGFLCGRRHKSAGDIARDIQAGLNEDSTSILKAQILRVAKSRPGEFKVLGESVSASRASDRDCGTD